MRYFLLMVSLLMTVAWLVGCVSVTETKSASGQNQYVITCSGKDASWKLCYSRARRICEAPGYEVLDRSTDKKTVVVDGSSYGLYTSEMQHRELTVACKQPSHNSI